MAADGFGLSRFRRQCLEQECMDRWPCAVQRLLADAGFGCDSFHGEGVRAAALSEAHDGGEHARGGGRTGHATSIETRRSVSLRVSMGS